MHLKHPGFTYSSCGPFTRNKERIKKFKETGDIFKETRYIYQNELNKACFQDDAACGDFKDLSRRTTADKVLRDKVFNIAKNSKYDGYQRGVASMVYQFFDKEVASLVDKATSGGVVKNKIIFKKVLAEELHKPIIRKFEKRKLHSTFKGCRFSRYAIDK